MKKRAGPLAEISLEFAEIRSDTGSTFQSDDFGVFLYLFERKNIALARLGEINK